MLLVFLKQCDEIEFPNAVDSTQHLLHQHCTQKNELEQEFQRIKTYVFRAREIFVLLHRKHVKII